MMHLSRRKCHSQLCRHLQWDTLRMPKMQTYISCLALQMRLHGQLKKQARFTSRNMMLVDEELHARSPSLKESIMNVVADRPESSTSAVAHQVNVSHQTI
ncbi:hypothetical protein TNCV_3595141 [Trichonephila clavipes]|nr:hypothetical protein TNCV_3595141 [Trichonephila clavipes]